MQNMITIQNDGPDLRATNYWESEHSRRGYAFLSLNAGTFRLLLPPAMAGALAEMQSSAEVIVSRGPWTQQGGRDALEVLFEDHSDSPYMLHLVTEQADMLPDKTRTDLKFTVWTPDGKAGQWPCKFRKVKSIPWMKPWK